MKAKPSYYTDWLAWAATKYADLEGGERQIFLQEVWEVFRLVLVGVAPGPLTLKTLLKKAAGRWDPLEEPRNRMEGIRKAYEL